MGSLQLAANHFWVGNVFYFEISNLLDGSLTPSGERLFVRLVD